MFQTCKNFMLRNLPAGRIVCVRDRMNIWLKANEPRNTVSNVEVVFDGECVGRRAEGRL